MEHAYIREIGIYGRNYIMYVRWYIWNVDIKITKEYRYIMHDSMDERMNKGWWLLVSEYKCLYKQFWGLYKGF